MTAQRTILPQRMSRCPSPSRIAVVLAGLAIGTPLCACKKPVPIRAPMAPRVEDDIDTIEAELATNAEALEAQGIRVARADAAPDDSADGFDVGGAEPAPESTPIPAPAEPPAADDARATRTEREASKKQAKRSRGSFWSRWLAKRERKKDEAERCQRICDLAEATCGLADQVCDLAGRHPDEVRYEQACERAENQCELASEACTACAR